MKDSYELSGPKVIPLVDPTTKEELKLTKDGYFQNPRTKDIFAVNDSGFVIELKDPETNSKAHIENDFLVSDSTGKKYPINEKGQVIIHKPEEEISKKQPTTLPQKTPIKQVSIEDIYKNYVYNVLNTILKESGVIVEFSMDKENKICSSTVVSTTGLNKRIVYAMRFQNTDSFQNNVLFTIVREFSKMSGNLSFKIIENINNYNCTLKNNDNDTVSFINITDGCSRKLKTEVEKVRGNIEKKKPEPKKQIPIENQEQVPDEDLEKFKFYLVTITISLLIILCVFGIILLLG